jgi:hypothetical protein
MTCGVERGEESRGILIRIRIAGKPYASKFAGAGNKGRAPNEENHPMRGSLRETNG